MNKTLLLIIIDFLFLNLIALTQWEKLEVSRPPAPVGTMVAAEPADTPPPRDLDLVAAMEQSLADESHQRAALIQKLSATEATLDQRQKNLEQMASDKTQLEAEKSRLNTVLSDTRNSAQQLKLQVATAEQDASVTKAQMDRLRRELAEKQAEAERQQASISKLQEEQSEARHKIEGLSVAVKAAEQEKQVLRENVETFKQQAQAERVEREKVQATTVQLAQGVGQLAESSGALTKEIRDNRPVNANVIFNDFVNNRVTVTFNAWRKTFLGPVTRNSEAKTIFVTDGNQVYALLHIADTPFSVRENGADWERFIADFSRTGHTSAVNRMSFLTIDPRVVALPVDAAQAAALGVTVYKLAADPFKFPEAVLINGGGTGYGEVAFKLDASEPGYVRVDNRLMKRLFGDFAPSGGDLVISKTGELLGIMVNSDYCVVVNAFTSARSIQTGLDIKAQGTGVILDDLAARYRALPLKLQ